MLFLVGLLGCLLVAGVVVAVRQRPDRARRGATTPGDPTVLLGRLADRLRRDGSPALADPALASLAVTGDVRAAGELTTLRANVRRLGIPDLQLRYLPGTARRPTLVQRQRLGPHAWLGDVRLRWRLPDDVRQSAVVRVPVAFRGTGGRARFLSARLDSGGATPLWLLHRVTVARSDRALVVTGSRHPTRLLPLADRAVRQVRAVLPWWRGRLVVEVPPTRSALGRVLGSPPDAYDGVAAVTTTEDGSDSPRAPAHVYVNRSVFGELGPRGAQVVLSHEATHVATGGATSGMPTWLLEGFADYVALDRAGLSVTVSAAQALASVRSRGAPRHLPGPRAFAAHEATRGAAYESSWLACRLLAGTYGERRLVAFYRAADRTSSTTLAFRTVLGTDRQAFTRAWRADLLRLAG